MFSETARQRRRPESRRSQGTASSSSRQERGQHKRDRYESSQPFWLQRLLRIFKISLSWKQFVGFSLLGLGVWYGTPLVSDFLVPTILNLAVPIAADIELGQHVYRQENLHRSTYYDAYWTPQIQSIGNDLVQVHQDQDYQRQRSGRKDNDLPHQILDWLKDSWEEIQQTSSSPKNKRNRNRRSEKSAFVWDFGVVDEPRVVNAFALPGGIIRVTSALLEELDLTRGEVAALIGHEMGHIVHRHGAGQVLERRLLETLLQAVVYEDDDLHRESWGEAVGEILLDSADWLGQKAFSRRHEYQADETSWDLLVSSHEYDPKALQSLLTKLWDHHTKHQPGTRKDSGRTSWESTHPGTLDRLQALDRKWEALSPSERRRLQRTNTVR